MNWFAFLLMVIINCDIPVFRQALESWPQEKYKIIIWGKDPSSFFIPGDLNAEIVFIKKTNGLNSNIKKFLKTKNGLAVFPFFFGFQKPIFVTSASQERIDHIIESPARKQIVELICSGESAIWVLILSGIKHKDEQVKKLLSGELKKLEKELKLPNPPEAYIGRGGPEIKVSFSLITLNKDSEEEEFFIKNLLSVREGLEKDLKEGPIAFPVFGRARVLDALTYDMITKEKVFELCSFLVGPCTCDVGDKSVGTDLLIKAEWPKFKEGFEIQEIELPSLCDLKQQKKEEKITKPIKSTLWRNTIVAFLVFIAVISLFSYAALRKRRKLL